jgi:chorismate synthase
MLLRYLTAGESHGQALVGILEGMPAGVRITKAAIDHELARRQHGYGRGGRMLIEKDQVEILAGVRFGESLGSPIALLVRNRDWAHWEKRMAVEGEPEGDIPFTRPRPGHADLVGVLKYAREDARDILERASARETTMRVALGALAKAFLRTFGIEIGSHVLAVGDVWAEEREVTPEALAAADGTPLRCLDDGATERMMAAIDRAKEAGDTLGGVFEVVAFGLPPGLGSHVHFDRKLDGRIGQAMLSIPAMKGVTVGDAFQVAGRLGSEAHDAITFERGVGFRREGNRAGGLEGGMTNGEPLVVRVAMKPLSTLRRPLPSVDLATLQPFEAQVERSDVTAVPAAGVIGEAMLALVLADAFLEKFGADTLPDIEAAWRHYLGRLPR